MSGVNANGTAPGAEQGDESEEAREAGRKRAPRTPGSLRRIVRHEGRTLHSHVLWVTRRRNGVGAGHRAFGYAKGQAAMVYGVAFACLVETVGISYLLRELPVLHGVMLVLDVYTLLMVLGLQAAAVTRPHVLAATELRVRRGAAVDLRIPFAEITAVRRGLRTSPERPPGELVLDVGALTNVILELATPLTHTTLLGRTESFSVLHLYAEDPDALVGEVRAATAPTG
ncbi:hypothetical protein [Streptomyces sp. NPDC005955]|uniref:hypothetical protein n=1 Tax=Streptomyces sp. NPDC005955 TaxID=3364738 RepID=UPI00368A298E